MSYPFGITGTNFSPYMNGLGMLGLGTSSYGSYGDMTAMGMMSPYNMGMGMGMMGMYNPAFMAQMTQMQQNIEKSQLQHTTDMHQMMLNNNVEQFKVQDRALFEKAMQDAAINKGIANLANKIREGDADGICEEFDALKETLYNKYSDYFKANSSKISPNESLTNWIEILYGQIVSKQQGEIVDLRNDIKKYGETAFEHGFWQNLHGKDYHKKYSEETLSYIYGTRVDNKSGKDRMEKYGKWTERIVEGGVAATAGAIAGKLCPKLPKGKWIGATLALAGDIWWQMSRSEQNA